MPSNGQLRTCQVLVFIMSGTAGLVVSISVGWTSRILDGQCVLRSSMRMKSYSNGSVALVPSATTFGNPLECSFSTFCPVGVTIYCVIWIWFYIFLSDWGTSFIEDEKPVIEEVSDKSPPADQHLLIPSIACNVVVLGLLLATVAIVEAGMSVWCEHVVINLGDKACDYLGTTSWLNVEDGENIYGYLTHARISCWVLLFSMIFQTLVIFIRLRRNSRRPLLEPDPFLDFGSTEWPRSEPETSEPRLSEAEVLESQCSEPGTSEPQSTEPDVSTSQFPEPKVSTTQFPEPKVTIAQFSEPQVSPSRVSGPDISETDSAMSENRPPARRRLQRQKRVVIDVEDDIHEQSGGLLRNNNEYGAIPS